MDRIGVAPREVERTRVSVKITDEVTNRPRHRKVFKMRHFLLFTLIIALAVPPLFGNVIVKRQTLDEGEKVPELQAPRT